MKNQEKKLTYVYTVCKDRSKNFMIKSSFVKSKSKIISIICTHHSELKKKKTIKKQDHNYL